MVWTCPELVFRAILTFNRMEYVKLGLKTTAISGISALYWYVFLVFIMGWYATEFHVLATLGTVIMVYMGKAGGILGNLV